MVFNPDLIDFFKRHNLYDKDMFDYLSYNSTMIDYKDPDQRCFIGCFPVFDKKNKLIKIHLCVPYVYDDITMLISIHELVHGITLYKKINKKCDIGIDCEVIPMLYEKIYINENNNSELINYANKIDDMINTENDIKYMLGLILRDELIDKYYPDIKKLEKQVKKLVKIYKY